VGSVVLLSIPNSTVSTDAPKVNVRAIALICFLTRRLRHIDQSAKVGSADVF